MVTQHSSQMCSSQSYQRHHSCCRRLNQQRWVRNRPQGYLGVPRLHGRRLLRTDLMTRQRERESVQRRQKRPKQALLTSVRRQSCETAVALCEKRRSISAPLGVLSLRSSPLMMMKVVH